MRKQESKPVWGQVHLGRRLYLLWAATVAEMAKTPRHLPKPRAELSDLEFAAAVIKEHGADMVQLWEAFTTERSEVGRYLMDPKREALVYLLGFHLANQARTLGVLQRLQTRSGLLSYLAQAKAPIHLVDLGCGSGALSLTLADSLRQESPDIALKVELVDKSQAFLDVAAFGLRSMLGQEALTLRRQKLDEYLSREAGSGVPEGLHWYQLGYLWNEIVRQPKTSQMLLNYLERGLNKGSRLITLIEPANQDIAREAMRLRDELVQRGYRVIYPCPHQEPCPMLERSRDWCYSEFSWERPPLMNAVDKILKVERHRLGCSAYVFASPDLAEALARHRGAESPREEAIVVGRPLKQSAPKNSRAFEYLLCTSEGLAKENFDPSGPELLRGQTWAKPGVRSTLPIKKPIKPKK